MEKNIVENHLEVPGLIGPRETFVNLKGYLAYNYSHVKKVYNEIEGKLTDYVDE